MPRDPVHSKPLADLEAPVLDFAGEDAPELLLRRLRTQNRALDRLRAALAIEEPAESEFVPSF